MSDNRLTPKYWVAWDNTTNNIRVETLDKSLINSRSKFNRLLGYNKDGNKLHWSDYVDSGEIEFILISIEKIQPAG